MATTSATTIATNAITNTTNILTNTVTNAANNLNDALTTPTFSNAAPTKILDGGYVVEIKSPSLPNGGFFHTEGSQTTPGLSRGALHNSSLANNNADLSHVCDFKFTFADGISLSGLINPIAALQNAVKNGKMAAANAIRAAISQLQQGFRAAVTAILSALLGDVTGQFSLQFSVGKYYVRMVNEAINKAAQVVYDISLIVNLVKDLQQIITYIESLPSQLQQILKTCLVNFSNSLNSTVKSAQNAAQIHTVVSQAVNQSTANAQAYNGNSLNGSLVNLIGGSTSSADISALSNHISTTISNAPQSSGAAQKTASNP